MSSALSTGSSYLSSCHMYHIIAVYIAVSITGTSALSPTRFSTCASSETFPTGCIGSPYALLSFPHVRTNAIIPLLLISLGALPFMR